MHARRTRDTRPLLTVLALALLTITACSSPPPPEESDNLTVGKVQGEIKVGMDAASVAEILGSPNIVTTDDQRREVWIYDKISSDRVDTASSIGGGIIIFGGGKSSRQSTTNQRTLTIINKYDEEKTVRDFAYNYSSF
jgi:outer membrane protein assembly factor BamE (lipoprotein component of BamABCDE complex)